MFLSLGLDLDRIAVLDLGDGAAVADDVAGVIATVIPKGTGRGRLPQRAVAEEHLAAVPILGVVVTAVPVANVGAVLFVLALVVVFCFFGCVAASFLYSFFLLFF